jgi:hypothetical protein
MIVEAKLKARRKFEIKKGKPLVQRRHRPGKELDLDGK